MQSKQVELVLNEQVPVSEKCLLIEVGLVQQRGHMGPSGGACVSRQIDFQYAAGAAVYNVDEIRQHAGPGGVMAGQDVRDIDDIPRAR